jgi:hypothetical protein
MEDTMTKLIQLSTLLFVVLFAIPSNAVINVTVKTGINSSKLTVHRVDLDDSATVMNLKEKLTVLTNIPIDKQAIISGGKNLDNSEKNSSIPIINRGKLHLALNAPQIVDNLRDARNSFNTHLRAGDHDMARMTANSIIDSRRYTTPEKDEARSWLGRLPK